MMRGQNAIVLHTEIFQALFCFLLKEKSITFHWRSRKGPVRSLRPTTLHQMLEFSHKTRIFALTITNFNGV